MKAVTYARYGTTDTIRITDAPRPVPQDNEILVRIYETVVTPSDIAGRKGDPFLIRLFSGLTAPKHIAGTDFAGQVEAVGTRVTRFRPGDRVFGAAGHGAHAEYICTPEDGIVAAIPDNLNYRDVAGVCDAAMTALSFLRDQARLQAGQTILINGGSGSVGSAAVQLATYYGAEVTGVCSTANVGLVRSLGADRVIDYTREDFTQARGAYDVIFDAVGKSSFGRCRDALKPGGIYMTTVPTVRILLEMARTPVLGDKKALFAATGLQQTREKLEFLTQLLVSGQLKMTIDRCYPLEQIAEAHRYVETGRKRGSVVIEIAAPGLTEWAEDRRQPAAV